MWKRWLGLGPAVALTLASGALTGCDQNTQRNVEADARRQPPPNDQKVEKRVEHASRDLAAGATAVVEGVKKGVNEGVEQGKHDARPGHDSRYDDRSQDPNAPRRSSDQ